MENLSTQISLATHLGVIKAQLDTLDELLDVITALRVSIAAKVDDLAKDLENAGGS